MHKKIIVSETVRVGDETSVDQFWENVVPHLNSSLRTLYSAPLRNYHEDVIRLANNKISCRNRCMMDENFLMNTIMESGSSFQSPSARIDY